MNSVTISTDPIPIERARRAIQDNLVDCCRELLEFHNTGLLCNGVVRKIARNFGPTNRLAIVESLINEAALEFVISQNPTARVVDVAVSVLPTKPIPQLAP